MNKLGYKLYNASKVANPVVFFDGKAAPAQVSPLNVVFMHGLLGNHKNFTSVCTTLAGHDSAKKAESEGEGDMADFAAELSPKTSENPWIYDCAAFDWRNHGDSFHHLDTTLNGLGEDLQTFISSYAISRQEGGNTGNLEFPAELAVDPSIYIRESASISLEGPVPLSPDANPVPIVLCAHSMGAMVMMNWAWREHIKLWTDRIRYKSHSPSLYQNVFSNDLYKIVGAVVIDMSPSTRPKSFNNTIRMIEFLTQIPLLQFKNAKEVEKWLLEHGPQDVFNQQNIFQIRYHLSNLDFSDPKQPKWKIGLGEIIGGLHAILWDGGGFDTMKLAWETLNFANRRRIVEHKPVWEHPEKMSEFPFCFVFGETSPYFSQHSIDNIHHYFENPQIVNVKGADHFLFMRHKPQFMRVLRGFLNECQNEKPAVK